MRIDINKILAPPLVINLDKDTGRWNDIVEHFGSWNISPERFSAITNLKLPEISLPPSMLESEYNVSCNMSHAAASRYRLYRSNYPFWLVVEDDCRFVEDPRKVIADCISTLASNNIDWSIISLGCYSYDRQSKRPEIDYGTPLLCKPQGWYPWGAHAYLVNRAHAPKIISRWSACFYPADHLLLAEYATGEGYLRRPSIAYQEEYTSHSNGGDHSRSTKATADMSPDILNKICGDKNVD